MGYFQIDITERNRVLFIRSDAVELGNQYDNGAQSLVFLRPERYAGDQLILYFSDGETGFEPVNLGAANRFDITGDLTGRTTLSLQVAFSRSEGGLEHSNTLVFLLRPSLGGYAPVPPSLSRRMDQAEAAAFTGAGVEGNTLSFRNAKGETVSAVEIPGGDGAGGISADTAVSGISPGKYLGVSADGRVTGLDGGAAGMPEGGVPGQLLSRGAGGSAAWATYSAGDIALGECRNTDWYAVGASASVSYPNSRDIIYSSGNTAEGIRYDLDLEGLDSPVYFSFDMDFGAQPAASVWLGCLNPFGNLFQVFQGRNSFILTRARIRAWKNAGRTRVGLYIGGSSSGLSDARISDMTISARHPCGPDLERAVNDMCGNFGIYGKTYMLFGDSVIYASGWQDAFRKMAFPDHIYNRALGGGCLTWSPTQPTDNVTVKVDKMLAEETDFTPPDVVLVAAGLNDSVSNLDITFPVSPAAIESHFTLGGVSSVPLEDLNLAAAPAAMRYIQERIFTRFPDARIVFCPPMQTDNNYRTTASTLQKRECIRLTAERLAAGYIDTFQGAGVYDLAERQGHRHTIDGIHLNDAGALRFAKCIFDGLRRI